MEKVEIQLIDFWQKYPEYFAGNEYSQSIRSDLKLALELYARALDPEEYEQLTRRVAAFKAHTLKQTQKRMSELIREKEAHSLNLENVNKEFRNYEAKILKIREEMRTFRFEQEASARKARRPMRSDYFFVVLDVVGIILLYAGFILSERIDYSIVLMGCMCFIAGFYMHRGGRSQAVTASGISEEMGTRIQSRYDYVQEVWAVKKLTLLQKQRESLRKIELIDQEIEQNLQDQRIDSNKNSTPFSR